MSRDTMKDRLKGELANSLENSRRKSKEFDTMAFIYMTRRKMVSLTRTGKTPFSGSHDF